MWPNKRMRMQTRSFTRRSHEEYEAKLHLFGMPLVVQDHILSYLTISQLLKLRLVCKILKEWIDRKRKTMSEHVPRSRLSENGARTFKVFQAKRGLRHVITSVHLANDTLEVFDDPAMSKFLQEHAHSLKKLRMKRYFICSRNGKQTAFLEGLKKLEVLEVDQIRIVNEDDITTKVPKTFRKLKTLKLGLVTLYAEPGEPPEPGVPEYLSYERKKALRGHIWDLVDACVRLEFVRVPVTPKFMIDNTFDECYRLINYIRIRTNGISPRGFRAKQHIMQCDINNFFCCSQSLEVLLIVGARMRIQFLNVNSKVFRRGSTFSGDEPNPHNTRFDYIQSFLSSSIVNRSFEHVAKLTFKASLIQNECIIGRERGPSLFPNLKEFNIIMDIGCYVGLTCALYTRQTEPAYPGQPVTSYVCLPRADQMLLFFFPDNMPYKFVHTASIIFEDPVFPYQRRAPPEKLTSLPKIVSCFPALENLTLSGWNCKRETYLQLWNGFSKLKQLTLDRCSTLKPSCFVGGNGNMNIPENFLEFFSELEVLEFRGLEKMPGIGTQNGLRPPMYDVLSKLGLIQFHFLTRTEFESQIAFWIRPPKYTDHYPNPFPTSCKSNVMTRSVSRTVNKK